MATYSVAFAGSFMIIATGDAISRVAEIFNT